ncbi:response regulator transcription factor [Pedobacter sp. SYP-B3415]|uniref:response regulator transcription factor n=1 Tax=Pedobacter sp. SYP-B3415 TaxID=2496641 RepID=UPI00101CDE78|nr:response regulator transcription factor [Pedobacter sp. SYP-B3415]
MKRILIYEDNAQLREVLSILISATPGFEVVGAKADCRNILAETRTFDPELILMDIDMPGLSGIDGLKMLRANGITVKVVMLTVFEDNRNIFEAIRSGANGYILKKSSPVKIIAAIEDALDGGAPMTSSIATQVLQMFAERHREKRETPEFNLSAREQDVLNLLVKGFSYKLIAEELFISMDTVRSHIKKIYEKLQVNSKSEAVIKTLKYRDQI